MVDLNEVLIHASRKGNIEVTQEVIRQQPDVNNKPCKNAWLLT
jgi:hypothetical protein